MNVETSECAACHGEVHPDATRCMHCGLNFEPWYQTRWAMVLSAAAGLLLAAMLWALVIRPSL